MKKRAMLAVCVGLAACTTESAQQSEHTASMTTASAATGTALQLSGTKAEIFSAINRARAQQGLAPLTYNASLARAAQSHANDMVAKGYFSHTSQSGTTATQRVKSTGYATCLTAENNSKSYPSAAAAFEGWMNSTSHRKNILNKSIREVGVGHASGNMIVAVFAKPC